MAYRTLLLALAGVLAFAVVACGSGGSGNDLEDAGITADDVPSGWVPSDIDDSTGQPLWDLLPDLLLKNADAHLLLHAFESESGLHGVATMFIETDEAAALPETSGSESVLEPLTRLLVRQDEVLIPHPLGGDPGTYFSTSDALPGSLRSRLVRVLDEGTVYSDSMTFTVGRVLAVVTVWYPEDEEPFERVEDLALSVEGRLRDFDAHS